MLVAASEGLCCHKCPAWGGPWGHPARWEGGTKGLSPVLCPLQWHWDLCTHSLRPLCWFVNPRSPFSLQILLKAWPSRPGVMSLTQPPLPSPQPSSPAQSSPAPALEPNTNEASSRAALIRYEPQVKRNNFFKFRIFYPDKRSRVINSVFAAKALSSPLSLEPPQHSWTELLLALLAASPRSVPPEGSPPQALERSTPSHGYLLKPSVCTGTQGAQHSISAGFQTLCTPGRSK